MSSAEPGGDPREFYIDQVFSHLARAVLAEERDVATAERRLWRLPDVAAQFVCGAVTDVDRRQVEAIAHRLRLTAGTLINTRLDRAAEKSDLARRVARARDELTLRPWRTDDSAILASLLNSERLWAGLPEPYPGPVTEALATELITIANGWSVRQYVNAAEWHGEPVGQGRLQFDSSHFIDSAEISYWIGERFWGKGLGSHLVSLFTAESFSRWPQVDHIFANVLDYNLASLRVLEKAGYRHQTFRYRNVTKADAAHSTHVLAVCRA